MAFCSFFLIFVLFASNITDLNASDIYENTITWRNLQEFFDYGWKHSGNPVFAFAKPSDLDPKLLDLNAYTSDVWGFSTDSRENDIVFTLDLGAKAASCGLLHASLTIRYYISSYSRAGVGTGTEDCDYLRRCSHHMQQCNELKWETQTLVPNVWKSKVVRLYIRIDKNGVFLADEISLTVVVRQNEKNCPNSCQTDCKFKVIDCHNYYSCVNGTRKQFFSRKQEDGLAYNPKTESCDLLENVPECVKASKICSCEYRPHETNNALYYFCPDTCIMENCEEKSCPDGLFWKQDPETGLYQCAPIVIIAE